jgi:O-antigen/teichoic acid export membrane protein
MGKQQLIKNSAIGIMQLVFTAILTLVSVPIFIHKLGIELYGVFAVISVIGNLNLLANFGLNGALLVYVAKQGKCKESDYDIAATQIIMISLMFLFSIIAVYFKEFIVRDLFSIPEHYALEAQKLLMFLIFANSLLLIGQTYTAIIDAQQKIYITNICQFIYSSIYWGGMIAVVSLGNGLSAVGFVALTAATIWLILIWAYYKHLWGKLQLYGFKHEFKRVAVKQFRYGLKIYLSGLAGFLFEPLSKILLSNFIGLQAVGLFEIGMKVKSQINSVFTKALYPIYPYIANSPISDSLHKKIFDFSKKIQLIVIPISIILIFIMQILLKLWLGSENLTQVTIFVTTMTVTLLLLSPPVLFIYQYLAAKNMADKNIWVQMSSAIVNVVVFIFTYRILGVYSILVANTFGLLVSYFLCNYYQFKYFRIILKEELPYYLKMGIYGIFCTFCCGFIRFFIPFGIWDIIIYPSIVGILFIVFIRNFKLIDLSDLELYFETIPKLIKLLKKVLID